MMIWLVRYLGKEARAVVVAAERRLMKGLAEAMGERDVDRCGQTVVV